MSVSCMYLGFRFSSSSLAVMFISLLMCVWVSLSIFLLLCMYAVCMFLAFRFTSSSLAVMFISLLMCV